MTTRRREPSLDELVLSEREQRVLEAVIDAHLESREPVGSKSLAEQMSLSSATIRNVMGALGELGMIDKPHASAGRVPTAAGLRFYVDTMLKVRDPEEEDRREIAARVQEATSFDRAMEEAGRVLARLSQKACLVRAPKPSGVRLRQLELVRLRDDALLVILVTVDGSVQNRLVELGREGARLLAVPLPDAATLSGMSRYLTALVENKTLLEVKAVLEAEVEAAALGVEQLRLEALRVGQAVIAKGGERGGDVIVVEGERHLIEAAADAGDVKRVHELLLVLEEKTRLLELLDRAHEAPGVRIFIGDENPLKELADMSVVTSTYGEGEAVFGTLGVIGPVRMDYRRVVPLVEFTARMISELLR